MKLLTKGKLQDGDMLPKEVDPAEAEREALDVTRRQV